ncbi:hypothetical protein GM418_14435 [Maribellus comscasis]|uniref:Uncharacterized protein n=1 Tax=Maribellus comscasis TaxID=2681766 RepID=A0A6I6JR09_9BACT|nr:hypothetical protein [Maribellus comscasis]QGY44821.1 hypothetical protein GM418_14435 [Maribellus comscasis]
MCRTTTPKESEELFKICKNNTIEYYDVQIEFVDHLASLIEEQWKKQPETDFETALKKLGTYNFTQIKLQKENELSKKYNRLLWKYLLDFFSWPKVIMTLAFTLVLATTFKLVKNDIWIIAPYFGYYGALTLFVGYYYFIIFPKKFKTEKVNGKKFLLLEQLKRSQSMPILMAQIPIQIPNLWNMSEITFIQNTLGIFTISLLIIFFTISMFGELFYIPEKIKEHFKEQFPEFALK